MLKFFLNHLIKKGSLTVIHSNGKERTYEGKSLGPKVTIKIHNKKTERLLSFNPSLTLGETFMNGGITVENGDIYDFLELCVMNIGWGQDEHWLQSLLSKSRKWTRRIAQYNPVTKSKSNVAHHYALSDTLYDLFLDKDRQYSCAYYMNENESLETAQHNKKRHIAAKLLLNKNHDVLDVGSGWGGLGLYIAEETGANVTGITLSEEQLKVSKKRAKMSKVSDKIDFKLQDYRNEKNSYDRIVSVGMFEHVGVGFYKSFFEKIKDLLNDDGIALIHTIGRADGPGSTNPWLAKYIFPGGYTPSLSEIVPIIEKVGLFITDIEILRLHYASTLRAWRRNFNSNRKKITDLYDERFCRMWDFYLAGCENAFRYGGQLNFQIQIAKKQDTVPLTRDYITTWEQSHQ